jgi:hypothetical protein
MTAREYLFHALVLGAIGALAILIATGRLL